MRLLLLLLLFFSLLFYSRSLKHYNNKNMNACPLTKTCCGGLKMFRISFPVRYEQYSTIVEFNLGPLHYTNHYKFVPPAVQYTFHATMTRLEL